MKIKTAVEILENHNKWRRNIDDDVFIEMTDAKALGRAIDRIVYYFKSENKEVTR